MSIQFVATGILESNDGINFNVNTALETDEEREKRRIRELNESKPLYQQLEEQKAKKLEEEELKRKAIFAPPKGLDEDDIEYFKQLEENKEKIKGTRAANEEKLLEKFRSKQKETVINDLTSSSSIGNVSTLKIVPKENKQKDITIPIVKAKRKTISTTHSDSNKRIAENKDNKNVDENPIITIATSTTTITTTANNNNNNNTNNAFSLICDYGSDED